MARTSNKYNVGILFKTSNRKNSKTKVKVYKNRHIDDLLDGKFKWPGIPDSAVIVRTVIGDKLIKEIKSKLTGSLRV